MGLFDKAKQKAQEFANSDQGKEKVDGLLDQAEQTATDKLGEDKSDQVKKVRDGIEGQLGNNDQGGEEPEQNPEQN